MTLKEFYKDKVAIITGSTMGIGKELARQILLLGGKVVITGRNSDRLLNVKKEFDSYSNNVLFYCGDVSDYNSNEEMINKTIERFGKLDLLINNAGLSGFGEIGVMNAKTMKEIIDANIYGSLFPTMLALPHLKITNGSVLFISSVAGLHGLPGYSAYSLSKMSLKALAQSLYAELKLSKVFVGISYVGFTENESDKKTIAPDGTLVNVPKRPKLLTNSRQQTANKLLNQIKRRKHASVQSIVGIITFKVSQFFPSLLNSILKLNYIRSE